MLVSCGRGVGAADGATELVVEAGFILIRDAGRDSVLPSVCDCRLDVGGVWVRGCGDGAWAAAGFGDEVPDAGAEPEASGAVEEDRGVDGPPSFARRFARICARLSSAFLFGGELWGSCTLSASDMAESCSCAAAAGCGGGGSVMSWSAMVGD
jgi:hypothetical protein